MCPTTRPPLQWATTDKIRTLLSWNTSANPESLIFLDMGLHFIHTQVDIPA